MLTTDFPLYKDAGIMSERLTLSISLAGIDILEGTIRNQREGFVMYNINLNTILTIKLTGKDWEIDQHT